MNFKRVQSIDGNNTIERDLFLNDAGTVETITGVDDVGQRISERILFIRGEWFLNTLEGVPYRSQVYIKNPNLSHISLLFQRVIEETPGVGSVVSASARLSGRELSLSYVARTVDGDIIEDVLAL